MTTLALDIPRAEWWTANARTHWATRARKTRAIRARVGLTARAARMPRLSRAALVVTVHTPTDHRFDPHNAASTVIKAAIDGLVDAGVLPDDDHTHLPTVTIRRGPKTGIPGIYRLALELTPLEAQ